MDSVTESPSAGTAGPSTPLSAGGCAGPRLAGLPPLVRNRARVVSVRISSASPAFLSASTSNAAKQATACLSAGPGVSTPAWWAPWKG